MTVTSDIVHINSDLKGKEAAVLAVDDFNRINRLEGKDALHIRLITEELICLVHDIMKGFIGNLWLERKDTRQGTLCSVCLSAQRAATPEQEEQLLALASSHRNENSMGLIGRIREAIRLNMQLSSGGSIPAEYSAEDNWYKLGQGDRGITDDAKVGEILWSLEQYRKNLSEKNDASEEVEELERSIIAKLSDEVKIWITNDTTEVIIEKTVKK